MSNTDPIVVYNGELTRFSGIPPAAFERARKFGDGVFESMQTFGGRLAFAERHISRLSAGMRALKLEAPVWQASSAVERLQDFAANLVIAAGHGPRARIRLSVWRDGSGAFRPETNAANWLMEAAPLAAEIELFPQPISAALYEEIKITPGPLSGIKSLNSLPYVLAAQFAQSSGTDEALLLNTQGNAAEFSASNIFAIIENQVFTPPVSEGCLPGVARGYLLDNSPLIFGEKIIAKPLTLQQLALASEILSTNAISGPRAVSAISPLAYAPNREFPLTRKARAAWLEAALSVQSAQE